MKLGNTAGKNKGKKYLKITGKEEITAENQAKADHFKHWFGENYTRLRHELIQKDTFDEDILNETFLRIYDKIIFGGLLVLDYKAYFHRAFFTNFMQETINLSKGFMASIDGFDTIDDSDSDSELIRTKMQLESDILNYVYTNYPVRDFELFKMYVSLKPAINYAELSKITSISQSRISETIFKIRRDICKENVFVARRQSVVRGFVG
ncbi:hypothetical protein [Viscerimonas tarda]